MVVFLTRYWDLFLYWVSLYNFMMKLIFISATAYVIYLMKFKKPYCLSYDHQSDSFDHRKYLYPLAAVLTFFVHTRWTLFEASWSYSIWLEALAVYPQLHMIMKIKEIENLSSHYMACLGFYRFFYILSWILKYMNDEYVCLTSVLGGIVQTLLYADFLYYYIKSQGQPKIGLPV